MVDAGLVHRWSPTNDPNKAGTFVTDLKGSIPLDLTDAGLWEVNSQEGGSHCLYKDTNTVTRRAVATGVGVSSPWSITLWFERTSNPGTDAYVYSFNDTTTARNELICEPDRDIVSRVGDAATKRPWLAKFPDTGWQHYALTFDGTELKAYINGVDQNINETGIGWSNVTPQNLVFTTRFDFSAGTALAGRLDSIRTYNRVLTPAEVLTIYNATRAETGLDPEPPADEFQPWFAVRTTHIV